MLEHHKLSWTGRQSPGAVVIALVILLTLALPVLSGPMDASDSTVVRCQPTSIVGKIGEPVSFTINVEDVTDLYGADVQLAFDPLIVQVIDADANKGGVQIEMLDDFLELGFVIRERADNVAGTIWYANTQVNPMLPVNGSGPLARVTFQPIAAGSFEMPITSHELATRFGEILDSSAQDCQVTILDPNTLSSTYLPVVRRQ